MVVKRIYCYFLCSFALWVPMLAIQFDLAVGDDVATSCSMVGGLILYLPGTPVDMETPASGHMDLSGFLPMIFTT